ncbi:DNA translocase FtsK [Streptococcus suis]|uniref:DNA translocase FtsK n=1 Tax=Streptococcus suis TaxID=1307 RepID=A0A0Z8LY71_STRSU|nr:DNA translocase FtsK [Streptococcus suis]NQG74665.1 DNA translocase FtsK [Streptococcus suis]NQG79880.1 DNA translocase FtsK [Streptococcus suis]NQK16606.1 DNA translocase FtsK [Streptococcus suis]CYV98983.1 DNA segregation ATPase FtsK/SpoIIIE and related proteins [Streptococcus suis]CYW00859.1 DNA segregation ATPase FtsK/SpoIIIE and related proteins [Streptococcus suis]
MRKTSKKGKATRRPTKAELAQQERVKNITLRVLGLLFIAFAASRLGVFGVTSYNIFRLLFGSLAYLILAGAFIYLLIPKVLREREGTISGFWLIVIGLLIEFQAYLDWTYQGSDLFGHTLKLALSDLAKFQVTAFLGGGMIGSIFYLPVSFLFANVGSFFIGLLVIAFGIFFVSPWSVYDVADGLAVAKDKLVETQVKRAELRTQKKAEREEKRQQELARLEEERLRLEEEEESARALALVDRHVDLETGEILEEEPVQVPIISEYDHLDIEDEFPIMLAEDDQPAQSNSASQDSEPNEFEKDETDVQIDFKPKQRLAYKLPSIDLFAPIKAKSQSNEKRIVRQNIKVLEDTFASFGIKVVVERAEIGPSVTKYEVKPAVGVRVNRISNLADDLALALAAKDVRIEAPIPGKSLVGIEVPNSEVATVPFRELWEQSKTDPDKLLEIPLGKAVNGSVRSFNLARMPHLLVAGSTGSGKSVAVNGIISSILMKAGPDQVKFMMIDPKMVELSVYNDIPHLLIPVVTNPRKAARALQKVVDEMEKRYELFSQIGVRNLEGYNAKVEEFNSRSEEKQIPLPLIVVIVDELADLMMVASKEVEDAIIRLGQKARAAGIHMILATQRPSVDVISGLIKANVPSRIAFAVSSGTDSRTILDENGAEKLLGRGDMLFKPIDENHPVRLQGSFISDDDVEAIVGFIKDQADADYDESFDPGEVAEGDGDTVFGDAGGDPLFNEARALVVETQKASASMIQRRLSVGFNRATRLMEELEAAGVIGPAEGTKPRKVLETQ